MESIYTHADPSIAKVLVGNKLDLEDDRKVSKKEAEELAKQHKMDYFETSAKENINIDEVMQYMIESIYKNKTGTGEKPKSISLRKSDKKSDNSKGKGGCAC